MTQLTVLESDKQISTINTNDAEAISSGPESHLLAISRYIEELSGSLRHISLDIHDHPEIQYKEFHAHKILTEFLQKQVGWQVTPSAYGIETAFVAVFDTGRPGPVVSFNAEYDALKGIGHACGHNLIAAASVGAALATARLTRRERIGGKVVLFGTPAEEGGGGKIKLLEAGAYSDHNVDVSLMGHPGIGSNAALVRLAAFCSLKVEYFGKASHAAARPWDGINALDALITAYNAVSALRQQTRPDDLIQCQITNGGLRPNIIHAYSSALFCLRSSDRNRLAVLEERVTACFNAGAIATGATLKVTRKRAYEDHMPNKVLGSRYRDAFNRLGGDIPSAEIDYLTSSSVASSDQGNVSHVMPSIHTEIWIRSQDEDGNQLRGPHTPDFEKAARTVEAHELALRAAKALASTAVDVLTDPSVLVDAKREFEDMKSAS